MARTVQLPDTPRPATRPRHILWLLGPALVAGVAYLDPGNVASNMTAGAKFGYLLVWVVVTGNVMAWLIQYLSAKLGLVTGRSLPELLGERIGLRPARRLYWLQAELVAMATDVAEVIGGAVALWLLFDLPLFLGGIITGAISMVVLQLQNSGRHRSFEYVIVTLMLVIAVGFTAGVFLNPPDGGSVVEGLVPRFEGSESVLLAASILGATVMPHAIYAHSALTRDRFPGRTASLTTTRLIKATKWDVTIALAVAGSVNLAILLLAAGSLQGVEGTDTLEGAHAAIAASLGSVVATLFAVGLLASGLASTSVGAYAGAEIMQGLLKVRIPMLLRRLITLLPALAILAVGIDPTWALILSQVILSFGIPFALIPLVWLTAQRDLMGSHRNHWWTTGLGVLVSVLLVGLNVTLLVLTFTGA
ncbi:MULTISPECIES: Nramp family divalent metal transporter [unclassified Arthrobacter]|uniref:Nramp family divalent metal transporter n=1 Tax=unclassified Arthrobacter TaxID=235627 RepID=UPI00210262EB|nr:MULTISPECIES: Nramp family divalent metal transporter [unclassified Arthrobacter]MCQ1985925.1 Nramp family divalent metal transporter [Arthrobacter sp. zg-Y844]MCQ1994333.1 Nramp family divalent metal transporter [Arthrobacter sp. zg-Y1171]UWX81576.1 Nramp family divalent metal transporter [Arthrobacter sp. zg-Y1171]